MFTKQRWWSQPALFFLLVLTLVVVAACGSQPADDNDQVDDNVEIVDDETDTDGDLPDTEGEDEANGGISWRRLSEADLTSEMQTWLEANQETTGIYQENFGDETLVLVAWGEKPSTGYAVEVEDVTADGDTKLQLDISLVEPSGDDVTGDAITYPYDLIAVTPSNHYSLEPTFTGAVFLQNQAFKIDKPAMFAVIGDTLHVKGEARVFEGTLQVYLEDGHDVLVHTFVTASAGGPEWGTFEAELPLERQPTSPNGIITFYEDSAKDGSPIHELTYGVQFANWEK